MQAETLNFDEATNEPQITSRKWTAVLALTVMCVITTCLFVYSEKNAASNNLRSVINLADNVEFCWQKPFARGAGEVPKGTHDTFIIIQSLISMFPFISYDRLRRRQRDEWRTLLRQMCFRRISST
jgi:hypothetical protein